MSVRSVVVVRDRVLGKAQDRTDDSKENLVNSAQNRVSLPSLASRKALAPLHQGSLGRPCGPRPQAPRASAGQDGDASPAAVYPAVIRYDRDQLLSMRKGCGALQGSREMKAVIRETGVPCKPLPGAAKRDENAAYRHAEPRHKQIEYGRNTEGYRRFTELVPAHLRRPGDPVQPSVDQSCSKRSFLGQVSKWRRLLHLYDGVTSYEDCLAVREAILLASREKHLLKHPKAVETEAAPAV